MSKDFVDTLVFEIQSLFLRHALAVRSYANKCTANNDRGSRWITYHAQRVFHSPATAIIELCGYRFVYSSYRHLFDLFARKPSLVPSFFLLQSTCGISRENAALQLISLRQSGQLVA